MKVTIHKGSREIGGTCIQLSSGKTSILIDAGLPLSTDSQPVDLSRLIVDALLISHPHQDHFGLMDTLPPGTPVYIGKLARSLIDAPQLFIGKDRYALDFHDFKAWQPFTIGDFTITPYLVDHSATDAYASLIEAEGKRLFYSGDFRSHGKKGKLFENLVQRIVLLVVKDVFIGDDDTITIRHSIPVPQQRPPQGGNLRQARLTAKITFCVRGVIVPKLTRTGVLHAFCGSEARMLPKSQKIHPARGLNPPRRHEDVAVPCSIAPLKLKRAWSISAVC